MTDAAPAVYDDGLIHVDDKAVTLRRYYFPIATGKRIVFDDIDSVEVVPLGVGRRYRLWGSSDLRTWLPLDMRRPSKTTGLVITVKGSKRMNPACTPESPEQVAELIRSRISR